jgi:hypothetical protein
MDRITAKRIRLSGSTELHLTGTGDVLERSVVNFTSPDAWLFLDRISPSTVAARLMDRLEVNGRPARLDKNIRVTRFESGTVIIPHAPDFDAMTVFQNESLAGSFMPLKCYVKYDDAKLRTILGVLFLEGMRTGAHAGRSPWQEML